MKSGTDASAAYLDRLAEDARFLLRGWPDGAVEDMWCGLLAAVGAWKMEHGDRPGMDMADWVEVLRGYSPFENLLEQVARFDAEAKGRRAGAPLPRLCAIVVIKAADCGNWITAAKALPPVAGSASQARRRLGAKSNDIVTKMATAYLRRHPAATNRQVFEHLRSFSGTHMAFNDDEDAAHPGLDYFPATSSRDSKVIDYTAFSKRMNKIRRHLGLLLRIRYLRKPV